MLGVRHTGEQDLVSTLESSLGETGTSPHAHVLSARLYCHAFCAGTVSHLEIWWRANPARSPLSQSLYSGGERDSSGVISAVKQINKVTKYTAFEGRVKALEDLSKVGGAIPFRGPGKKWSSKGHGPAVSHAW